MKEEHGIVLQTFLGVQYFNLRMLLCNLKSPYMFHSYLRENVTVSYICQSSLTKKSEGDGFGAEELLLTLTLTYANVKYVMEKSRGF